MLRFATATADPERGALLQKVQERGTQIETALLFFDLEWAALDDELAEALLAADGLDFCRHHLRTRAPLPPAPAVRAGGADPRREGAHELQRVVAPVRGADRGDRRRRSRTPTSPSRSRSRCRGCSPPSATSAAPPPARSRAALEPGLRVRGYVLNTLLAEKMVDDRLRSYPHWLASRNLANEASDESVDGADRGGARPLRAAAPLVPAEGAAARRRPARRLRPDGRRSPTRTSRSRGRARRTSCSSRSPASRRSWPTPRGRSSTSAGSTRPVRPGKRGGAFCSYTVPSAAPYVMLNYTARRRDVLTLAHELGHGVHAALARHAGRVPLHDAADAGRDRERVRRDAGLRPPARGGADAGLPARAAGREHRGLDRDRVPPGRDEPLRAPRPHRRGASRASSRSTGSATCGRSRRRSCSATRSRSPTTTGSGGPTSPTSSTRRATSTRTRTGSCSRSRSTGATRSRARTSRPRT